MKSVEHNEILFTDLTNKYLLIEFPTSEVPTYSKHLFFELLSHGHTPVIVHPERNGYFREDPNRLIPFIEMGVITQLTAPSIVGVFGKNIQKTAMKMMRHNLIHMVASDAHNLKQRTFYLKEAYEMINKQFGREKVDLMQETTKNLINGDAVKLPEYSELKRGLGIFNRKF
jgi:protein-tyrosine phosphatase